MDREMMLRTLVAVALAFLVLVVWNKLFPPPLPPEEPAREAPAVEQPQEETPSPPAEPPPGAELPAAQALGAIEGEPGQPAIVIERDGHEVTLSARGGRILSWKLLDFPRDPGDPASPPIDLVSPESRVLDQMPLSISLIDEEEARRINESWHRTTRVRADAEAAGSLAVAEGSPGIRFEWSDGSRLAVMKEIFFPDDAPFLAAVRWSVQRGGQEAADARLVWGPGVARPTESSQASRYGYRGDVVYQLGGSVTRKRLRKLEQDLVWPLGASPDWIAIDNQYFAAALVPRSAGTAEVRMLEATVGDEPSRQPAVGVSARELALFAGPKSSRVLAEARRRLGAELPDLLYWGMFRFIAEPLYRLLAFFHGWAGNWGVAIVLLTVLIKLAFYPLTQRSLVRMRQAQAKMAKLQPKMRWIKEKYRDKRDMESRRKMNEEMMALYKKEGVNPMAPLAGCLPLLLQLPVLYGMYSVLTVVIDLRGAALFGWIRDLSSPDPYFITPIVMGVTMFLQQLLSMARVEDPQQRAQQRMMLFMPVMFTYFFVWLPSGLVLYWLTNNVLSILQQLIINRQAAAQTA